MHIKWSLLLQSQLYMARLLKSGIVTSTANYVDIDSYIEAIRHADLDLEVCQLSRGINCAWLQQSVGENFRFSAAFHCKSTEHLAHSSSTGLTFALAEQTADSMSVQSKVCSMNTLICVPEGAEFYAIGTDNAKMYSLTLTHAVLDQFCLGCLPRGARIQYPRTTTLYDLGHSQADRLRYALQRLSSRLQAIGGSNQETGGPSQEIGGPNQEIAVAELLDLEIIPALVSAMVGSVVVNEGKFGYHRTLFKVLLDINDNLDAPPKVSELAAKVGLTTRMLQLLFSQHIGLSPKAYIQAKRLNAVRRELCATKPNYGAISDAANSLGFWHMGQFSKDFKRQFGCNPSEFKAVIESLEQ